MSRLDELIQELCPDGVEYKPISEIGLLTRGKRFVHADAVEVGIPCIHYGELYTYYGVATVKTKSFVREELAAKLRYAQKNDVIIVGAGENDIDIGIGVAYLGDAQVAIHDACYILKHDQDPKFISYCLRTDDYHKQLKKYVSSGKICAISAEGVGKACIPVPPLEVQREIVRILDNFAELTAELTTKLTTELAARKKQYEYYRDELLAFGEEVEWLSLGTIFNIKNGYTPSKANGEFWEGGTIPWFRMEDIRKNGRFLFDALQHITPAAVKRGGLFPANSLIISTTATIGEHAMLKTAGLTNQQITNCSLKDEYRDKVNPQYAFYYFFKLGEWCKENINQGGGLAIIGTEKIKQFPFPVPPIEQQDRIADILDRFDALCNDISAGLPAEIEARQKQYEYYRDKLLTFKEVGA